MNLWCRGESLVPHFHGHGTWGAREIEMGREVIESGERIRRQAEECQEERERERERERETHIRIWVWGDN